MAWARTLRFDTVLHEGDRTALTEAVRGRGCAASFVPPTRYPRTYALIEGDDRIAPETITETFGEGRLFRNAIIAVAIEPTPEDALPAAVEALGGRGAPAGAIECLQFERALLLEADQEITPFSLILRILDAELRRFGGCRRTALLAPLPLSLYAAVAANGLQAPEIAPERILEVLLARHAD